MSGFVRTYLYKLDREVNAGKLRSLQALHAEWQRCLPLANRALLQHWHRHGTLPVALNYNQLDGFPTTTLPTNMQTAMLHAIIGQHGSWESNLQHRFRTGIAKSSLPAEIKHQLHWINRTKQWRLPHAKQIDYIQALPATSKANPPAELTIAASRLARKWFETYCRNHQRPNVNQLPIQLTQLTGKLNAPVKRKRRQSTTQSLAGATDQVSSSKKHFSHWLRLSTLQRGATIELPVRANPYAEQQLRLKHGKRANSMTLLQREGQWYLASYHQYQGNVEQQAALTQRGHVLAIDVGLNNLFATSDGDIIGAGYLTKLARYDAQLQQLQKGLQAAGIKRLSACQRYRVLVKRIKGWLKTQVETGLKTILERRQPRLLIIEALSFRNSNLSKRMNRLLHRFGYGVFQAALARYGEEWGMQVESVPAAYTSQTCYRCEFVAARNRAGNQFECRCCGKRSHADVNAAKNLLKRFQQVSQEPALCYLPYRRWWAITLQRWLERFKRLPLSSTRTIGCANKAWQYALAHKKRSGEGALEKRQRETAWLYISDTLSKVEKDALFKTIEQAISTSSTT